MESDRKNDLRKKCIDMWDWMSTQPDGTIKAEYFTDGSEPPEENCFACECDQILWNEDQCASLCENCPIDWGDFEDCESKGSPYYVWNKKNTKLNASIFLEFIKENWPMITTTKKE